MRNVALIVALGVAAAGCTESDPEEVSRSIGPGGGVLSSHDGVLTIAIPPGALPQTDVFTISPTSEPPMALGDAYRVEPNPQLMVDAEIVYRGMPAGADDITVGAVRRAAFDAKMGRWIPLPRIEVDPAHDLVAAIDGEISLFYGLIGQDGTASTTGTSSDSNDTPGTDTGTDPTAGGEDTEIGEVFFAGDIQPLFDEHCVTDCHEPGGMELANVMLDGNAYDRIVDQFPATATKPYIKPGEPENSYLMHKLDGTHTLDESFGGCGCSGAGATMPLNQLQLDQHTRNVVRAWIDQGAPP